MTWLTSLFVTAATQSSSSVVEAWKLGPMGFIRFACMS